MTIDSTWIQSLKADIPTAFTKGKPFQPIAVFIDGQIKLNSAYNEVTQTWDEYMRRQFLFTIQSYFRQPNSSINTVILAFDNYSLVPHAKNMTQVKRRKHVPTVPFDARDSLPPTVPKGHEWSSYLSNRSFKVKLVEMVIFFVVTHVQLREGQHLIIDYQSHPRRYNWKKEFEVMDDLEPLGESDVKFCRYTDIYPALQVDSIDGDSVPIALLHIEQQRMSDLIPKICILRMVTSLGSEQPAAKRARTDDNTVTSGETKNLKKSARVYEYVDINTLYAYLVSIVLPQCVGRCPISRVQGREISVLVGLIGLTGTDFTRKLSGVTGRTLYDYLPMLWLRITMAFDERRNAFSVEQVLDQVVRVIYQEKYQKHCPEGECGLAQVLMSLRRSKLGAKTKEAMQSYETLACTVKNINWLLQYWLHGSYPNPVSEEYGYRMGRNGAVDFAC